jgi:hypothetical protein
MAKNILSVGFRFPGDVVTYLAFDSNQTLLDADIIVFKPVASTMEAARFACPSYRVNSSAQLL